MENGSYPEDEHRWCYTLFQPGWFKLVWFVPEELKNMMLQQNLPDDTFGGSTELLILFMKSNNIIGTYLPAADIEAVNTESEFFSGQQINKHWSIGEAQIPSVNTGAFSAQKRLERITCSDS